MVKAAGNNAQPSSSKPKKIKSSVGAPSQLKQSSRKGKKAWRKNVDLEDLDDSLEGMRAEERTFGFVLLRDSLTILIPLGCQSIRGKTRTCLR